MKGKNTFASKYDLTANRYIYKMFNNKITLVLNYNKLKNNIKLSQIGNICFIYVCYCLYTWSPRRVLNKRVLQNRNSCGFSMLCLFCLRGTTFLFWPSNANLKLYDTIPLCFKFLI